MREQESRTLDGSDDEDAGRAVNPDSRPISGSRSGPAEIGRVLTADPRIAAAAVHARPDAQRENDIVLTVIAAAGVEIDEEDVRQLCGARLAAYKQPTVVRIGRGRGGAA